MNKEVEEFATQTQCYGLFSKRPAGTPKAVKLIDDRVYWDSDEARIAMASIDSPHAIEIRSMVLSVEPAIEQITLKITGCGRAATACKTG